MVWPVFRFHLLPFLFLLPFFATHTLARYPMVSDGYFGVCSSFHIVSSLSFRLFQQCPLDKYRWRHFCPFQMNASVRGTRMVEGIEEKLKLEWKSTIVQSQYHHYHHHYPSLPPLFRTYSNTCAWVSLHVFYWHRIGSIFSRTGWLQEKER